MGGNYQKYLAEVFGTAVLVLIGCASIVAEGFGAAAPIGFIGIGMAFGMTVTAMAFAIGPVSGCHLNPSVTAAVWASGRMSTSLTASLTSKEGSVLERKVRRLAVTLSSNAFGTASRVTVSPTLRRT